MSHEYILVSTHRFYQTMANAQDKKEPQWYVMRAYKNMKTAESRLSDANHGLRYFIPKQKVLRTISGKKVLSLEPVIHSLLFVYATQQQIIE